MNVRADDENCEWNKAREGGVGGGGGGGERGGRGQRQERALLAHVAEHLCHLMVVLYFPHSLQIMILAGHEEPGGRPGRQSGPSEMIRAAPGLGPGEGLRETSLRWIRIEVPQGPGR
eukprot:755413-Hanusia_phi.AAC.1